MLTCFIYEQNNKIYFANIYMYILCFILFIHNSVDGVI